MFSKCIMKIAIPSFNRHLTLGKNTLTFLNSMNGFELEDITIFVANQHQFDLYHAEYPDYSIVIGEKGIVNIRNFINQYYDLDQYVVCLDDDIEKLNEENPNLFIEGENELNRTGFSLWGVNCISNKFFIDKQAKITNTLKFCIGGMFGIKNKKIILDHECSTKEDYQNTILHYFHSKGIVRFNHVSFKSKMFADGGIGNQIDRLNQNEIAVNYLLEIYPTLTSLFLRKNGWKEIRLRPTHRFEL